MSDRPHVLIAGAGIGGLTAALSLIRLGFVVEVYEQTSELREVGAGVLISPNGMLILRRLGLADRVLAVSAQPHRREVRLWNTGDAWPAYELSSVAASRYGQPFAWLYRPDLLDLLARAVAEAAPGAIRLGRKVSGCAETAHGASLHFSDGGSATGDALVGADGVHSVVRAALHGSDSAQFSGFIAWRGIIPFASLPARFADGIAKTWLGPSGHFVEYPVRRGELLNFAGVVERDDWRTESWSTTGAREQLETDFQGWHDDVQMMIRAVQQPYIWALTTRRPLPRWSSGRITLLGDACHPTLPFLGQGATMAIEDGFLLARALEVHGSDVTEGFNAYERARKERTSRLVSGAADNAKRLNNPVLAEPDGARAYLNREYSAPQMSERYDWIYKYDAVNVAI